MKENVRYVLASMFDETEEIKKIKNDALVKEYEETMEQFEKDCKKREQEERVSVIESLTDEEIALVVKLHMQKILKEYETQSKSSVNIIVNDLER